MVVEKLHRKIYGSPQCHSFQYFGHTQNYFNHTSWCVKCGENLHTERCTKDRNSPAKCALCSMDHTVNYHGCQVSLKIKIKKEDPSKSSSNNGNTKTYTEATSNKNFPSEHISASFSYLISNKFTCQSTNHTSLFSAKCFYEQR